MWEYKLIVEIYTGFELLRGVCGNYMLIVKIQLCSIQVWNFEWGLLGYMLIVEIHVGLVYRFGTLRGVC